MPRIDQGHRASRPRRSFPMSRLTFLSDEELTPALCFKVLDSRRSSYRCVPKPLRCTESVLRWASAISWATTRPKNAVQRSYGQLSWDNEKPLDRFCPRAFEGLLLLVTALDMLRRKACNHASRTKSFQEKGLSWHLSDMQSRRLIDHVSTEQSAKEVKFRDV